MKVGRWATIAVAASTLSGATPVSAQPVDEGLPPVLVVGHRGAAKEAPEHTGPSYDRAVRAGADILECDLQLTADEELVCLHDTTVDRTTGGAHTGRVDAYTLDELRDMDFGSWFAPEFAGARIVTLEEQITCYRGADPTMRFYVETKAPAEYGGRMEPLLVEELTRLDMVPSGAPDPRRAPVIVQSFDAQSLVAVRQLAPSLPLASLSYSAPDPAAVATVEVFAPGGDQFVLAPDVVAAVHAAGRELHTWTVDDPARMGALVDGGIDGFFTNDPATARAVVDQRGRGSGRTPIAQPDLAAHSPGCPAGMGLGIRSNEAERPSTTTAASAAGSSDDSSGSSSSTVWIVVGAAAIGAVLVGGVVLLLRRRRSAA